MTAQSLSAEREALAEWLRVSFATDAVRLSTWTFRTPPWGTVGVSYASRAGLQLSQRLDRSGLSAFLARERGSESGRQHWHGLVAVTEKVYTPLEWTERWWQNKYGFTKIGEPTEPRAAATAYVTKYVLKSDLQFYAVGPRFAAEFAWERP